MVSTSPANPGKLLKSFRMMSSSRYPASILQISSDGRRVALVRSRLIVLWHPESLQSYELESVHPGADLFPYPFCPTATFLRAATTPASRCATC